MVNIAVWPNKRLQLTMSIFDVSDIKKCPECSSNKTIKAGLSPRKRKWVQRYRCNNCLRFFLEPDKKKGR